MQAICEITESKQKTTYLVAGHSIVVETLDTWAAKVIDELFAGWYLTPAGTAKETSSAPAIVIRSGASPPQGPKDWPQFEIAGGGTCYTDGRTSYIDIDGSVVAIDTPGFAAVEVWASGPLDIQSPVLTRIVTYALAAALRRRRLFELHSGAVIHPQSDSGVLIIGPSGSGKSTLTVQLATAGWSFLTDDGLLLSEDVAVRAWPLRRCFAITSETFAASNFLQKRTSPDHLKTPAGDKKKFVPHQVFASGFREHCTPKTLIFSELESDGPSQVQRLSAAQTMARLIRMNPWSCYDRATAADHLALLSSLVRQATGYHLLAGKDLLDPEFASSLIANYVQN
jgi:hypothetical protein